MPPRKPKLVDVDPMFPTWDSLVAEAHVDLPVYKIGHPDGPIEIPCPDGANYIKLVEANKTMDAHGIFEALFPLEGPPEGWEPEINAYGDPIPWRDETGEAKRDRMRKLFAGADFPIYDVLAGKVIRYYFGVSGNSGKFQAS